MDVVAAEVEVFFVADSVVGEAALPDWSFGRETVGEAALDELHDAFERKEFWGEEEVDVVGHDDEGVEVVVLAVVVKGGEEEFGVAGDLEEAAAVLCGGCDEVGAGASGAGWDRHSAMVSVPQRLKPLDFWGIVRHG